MSAIVKCCQQVAGRQRVPGPVSRTFYPEHERYPDDRFLLHVRSDMRHQGKVLDQTACFSFGRVAGTKHAPLTGLQRSRPTDLTRLLELRRDTGHHPQGRNERKPTQHVRDARPVHFETLERPVSGGDRPHKTGSDVIALELHRVERVKLACAGRLLQHFVNCGFKVGVECLEQVFEQER